MPKFQGPGGFDMQRLMKEAQRIQDAAGKVEEELTNKVVEGSAGGGMVKISMTCAMQVKEVTIDKEVVDPDDVEMLQDLIMAAVNAATQKAKDTSQEEMAKVTGNLPFKM